MITQTEKTVLANAARDDAVDAMSACFDHISFAMSAARNGALAESIGNNTMSAKYWQKCTANQELARVAFDNWAYYVEKLFNLNNPIIHNGLEYIPQSFDSM